MKKTTKRSKKKKPVKREGDLSFLLEPPKSKRGIQDRQVRQFVRLAKTTKTTDEIAKEMKVSAFTVTQLRAELKRAAKKKYTLKRYLEEGRPLRYGNKILAK